MNTHTKDPCADDCLCRTVPAEFVRMRYFFGQRLGVVDLADEQSYLVGKQRFHNRLAHGVGVLCGLDADRYVFPQGSDPNSPTTLLRVRRGAALDACGREIVVGWDQCIDVAAWLAQHPEAQQALNAGATSLPLWVALCYCECPSDPSPAPRDPCGCDAGGCEFARIREGFLLKLITDDEAKLIAPKDDQADAQVPDGSSAPDVARIAAQLAAAKCPEPPEDPCLLLASFQAKLDSTGKKVVDISAPDNAVPQRLSLLSTSVLQHWLLPALQAASDAELIGLGPRLGAITFTDAGTDSGTLTIAVDSGDELSADPFPGSALLTANVYRFLDTGKWKKEPAFTASYVSALPRHVEIKWASGLVDGGRYRISIENDLAQPAVDKRMRPLSPPRWARHIRLQKGSDGKLALASTLF
jgi:hypothetical protein